jgi:hypothetical protein
MDGARSPIQQCIRRPREVECDNIDVGDHYVFTRKSANCVPSCITWRSISSLWLIRFPCRIPRR